MPVLPFVYLAFMIGWALMIFGYYIKDYIIKSLGSFYFMVLGVYVLIYGIEGITNVAIVGLGAIHVGIGFYIIFTESLEQYKDM